MAGKTVILSLTGDTYVPASAISDISFIANALGGTTTTTSFSITLPATAAGDILICEFSHRGTGDGTIGGTSVTTGGLTWTLKHSQLFGSSAFSGKTYWTRATGDHAGQTVTGADLTNACAAIVTQYRGAAASGDPLADATIVGEQNASGNETQAEITTATNKAWVVLVVVNSPDLAVATQACTSPGTLTERAERLSTGGTDASIAHASAAKATAGATGALTWTQTDAASGSWAYAIKPNVTTPFADARAAMRDGGDSAQSEAGGWDAKVKPNIPLANIVRTSDTVCTITLQAQADYDITAQETITWTIPGSILTGGSPIVAAPTFTIDPVAAGTTVSVPAVSHNYTANAPKVSASVKPAPATHSYTTQAPKFVGTVRPAQATHTYTGQAPQLRARVQPGQATHSYVAQAPQLRARVQPAPATHIYTGHVPSITAVSGVSAPATTHTYTGRTPQVRSRVQPGQATHGYVGQVPVLVGTLKPGQVTHSYVVRTPQVRASVGPAPATHSYTGRAPQVKSRVQATPATHSYAGQATQVRVRVQVGQVVHSYTMRVPAPLSHLRPVPAVHSYVILTPGIAAGGTLIPDPAVHSYAPRTPKLQGNVQPGAAVHTYTAFSGTVVVIVFGPGRITAQDRQRGVAASERQRGISATDRARGSEGSDE